MKAPTFTLKNTQGEDVTLPKKGIVVVYFYPKADTPGCTLEGKKFTELYPQFIDAGAFVFGISPDKVDAICSFAEKYGFAHNLLSDVGHKVAEKYSVRKEKNMYGKKYWGVDRKTFLIVDQEIVKEYKHKPGTTEEEILEDIKEL